MSELTLSTNRNHRAMVKQLLKPGDQVLTYLTPEKVDLTHAAMGVSGEAGELLDAIKKHVFYNKRIDRENVIEELGDIEFYLEAIRAALLITREETLEHNLNKLLTGDKARYKAGYSDQAAQERADKQ